MAKNRTNKDLSEDQSMGILNIDELKVFGEYSRGSNASAHKISGRLNHERIKALETLQRPRKINFFRKPHDVTNKENSNTLNESPKLDQTDYVSYCKPNTLNITDLITDETIDLETSSSISSATINTKVSFEPAEITGRSTHYKNENVQNQKQLDSSTACARLSVCEILASSKASKARNLCGVLSDRSSSSSFNSYDNSHSLPRTADMSMSKNSFSKISFGAAINSNGFLAFVNSNNDGQDSALDDFIPGELMQSKLLIDEIAWAQQYAAIPAAALSEQAKAQAKCSPTINTTNFDSPSLTNSMIAGNPDISLGEFFGKRSEEICNIVQDKTPKKCRTPTALVDDDDDTVSTTYRNTALDSATNISITPKIDNKTYNKVALSPNSKNDKHESKDSGNSSDTSFLMSMSAINRALCNLDIQTDDSDEGVVNKLKLHGKKQKSNKNYRDPCEKDTEVELCAKSAVQNISSELKLHIEELLMENKENVNPNTLGKPGNLSDTLSFTESLLNSSAMKTPDQSMSIRKARSPLTPIENIPIVVVNEEEDADADIDEWPSTPIKLPNRLVRRTKTPKDSSARSDYISISPEIGNSLNSRSELPTKSLCSTRLDCEKNTSNKCDCNSSPKLSKSYSSAGHVSGNNSPSICSSRTGSPVSYELSPLSSPRSCLSSQASSPSGGYHSPHLDSTSNSDRRFLNVAGAVRRTNSSPVYNELSSKCCNFPVRNNSRTSMKSGISAAGRSTSSCSNTSEFSHRDGKLIPLKVTCLELSWSSSRLRRDVRKTLQVKNISNKRLVVRMEVHGPGFQVVSTQGNTLTLQSQECRSITINFCATVIGTAVGSLSFYSPHGTTSNSKPFLEIPLNAYGGHASIFPRHIIKGLVGAPFLPMGDLRELHNPLEQTFELYNKGPLLGFASISIMSSGLSLPRIYNAFEIIPDRMLIAPDSSVTVRVIFRPKREDIKNIYKNISSVLNLANMHVIVGDEAHRQRVRRLIARMSPEERIKMESAFLDKLWLEFNNEVEMSELEAFKEEPDVAMDLLCTLHTYEVSLILNNDGLNETTINSSISCPDADETVLFRTVYAASPTPQQMLAPVDELLEGTLVADDDRAVSSTREGSWSVRPNIIEFDFMAERCQNRVSLLIRNSYKSRQYFEVVCNCKDLLQFTPSDGYVQPDGGQIEVEVNTKHERAPTDIRSREVMIMVYLENERITVPVKIPDDNFA